jgi:UDP-2,3-diacylglucosamine hydrolase
MLGQTLVVVSDAHIGAERGPETESFLAFLERVPTLGDCLLVNGDLFEFWFSYRRAIPQAGFQVAAALAMLRRRIPIAMTGGNHDRWGHDFWHREANILFHPDQLRLAVGARHILAVHGDGHLDGRGSPALLHRVITHPITEGVFGLLHPDVGLWLIRKLGRSLADKTTDPMILDAAQTRQAEWARAQLAADPTLGLVILSHTHRPEMAEVDPGRFYLNPGAWIEGRCYAIVTESAISSHRF